jgi:hypothetical protein
MAQYILQPLSLLSLIEVTQISRTSTNDWPGSKSLDRIQTSLEYKTGRHAIIAYDRKMKEFAIKEVKGCRKDWLLRLKAISQTNLVRFVAGFFQEGSIYLICDLMSTPLVDVLSVSNLPLDDVATVCKV